MTLILTGLVVGICVVFGLILLIVPGLIILTLWSVASPVVVVENTGVFDALARSRALVRGNGWQVFGVIASVFVLILVVSIVIGSIGAIGNSFVLIFLVQLLLNVALAPIFALAAAVLYFALRSAQGQPVHDRSGDRRLRAAAGAGDGPGHRRFRESRAAAARRAAARFSVMS